MKNECGTVQKRKRKTFDQVHRDGYNYAVRSCVEALLAEGIDRADIAWTFEMGEIIFPTTDAPDDWQGLFAFEDWDDWKAADEV